jgi:putative Mg2+ transporter-C (MgtC) family protein
MPITINWPEIAIRLLCAFISAALIGLNRSEHGHAAGLRTLILVSLAACVSMIQVNLLLSLSGRASNSFVMNDLMRLPLGILSGMGFIGAGSIVRRDNFVVGVTTAATLWFVTVIGLCFGGGQIGLGFAGAAIALFVLIGLKLLEDRLKQDYQGRLEIVTTASGPNEEEIRALLRGDGFEILSCGYKTAKDGGDHELACELRWRTQTDMAKVPDAVYQLAQRMGVVRVQWTPQTH